MQSSGKWYFQGGGAVTVFLMLAAITMPYMNQVNSYALAAFGLAVLVTGSPAGKLQALRRNWVSWFLPLLYFAWIFLHYLLDGSRDRSPHLLEKNASLAVLPLLIASIGRLDGTALRRILLAFAYSVLAASVYCLIVAYVNYRSAGNEPDLLFYHQLSGAIDINAVYFSMYCLFSLAILLNYYFFGKTGWRAMLLAGSLICYLIVFMVMLASKMFLFLLSLGVVSVVVYHCLQIRKLVWGVAAILIFLGGIALMLDRFSYTRTRIGDTELKKYSGISDNVNGIAVRGIFWESSWQLICQEHGLLGMGPFRGRDALQRQERLGGFSDGGANKEYDSHNQYLYTWLCYGLGGLIMLVVLLIHYLWVAWRSELFPAIALGVLFTISNLTECMMETQKGIVFFLFFSSLFLSHVFSRTCR